MPHFISGSGDLTASLGQNLWVILGNPPWHMVDASLSGQGSLCSLCVFVSNCNAPSRLCTHRGHGFPQQEPLKLVDNVAMEPLAWDPGWWSCLSNSPDSQKLDQPTLAATSGPPPGAISMLDGFPIRGGMTSRAVLALFTAVLFSRAGFCEFCPFCSQVLCTCSQPLIDM